MAKLYNLARMTTATTGTGTITLGSASSGFLTFALAGVVNGEVVSYGIKDGASSEIGTGTYTSAGTTLTRTVTKSTNSDAAINLSGTAEVFITPRAEDLITPATVRSYLSGLTLSTAGSSQVFSIAAGVATDSTNVSMMSLAAFTKTAVGGFTWTLGSGGSALDTGAYSTNTFYHVFVIQRPDTGVVDVLVSLSATSPTLPTNYTLFRRIGTIKTDGSSNWTAFYQNGDTFLWSTLPALDYSTNNPGTSAVTVTTGVPTGVRVEAMLNATLRNVASAIGSSMLLSSLDIADTAPNLITSPLGSLAANSTATAFQSSQVRVWTNTSAQIRLRLSGSSTDITPYIQSIGWMDRRGRDA